MQNKNNHKNKKAFVSIFAIFFSAIVVSVLTSLYVLLIKQIEIMNLDSTSFQSLYMADSAFECALYYEKTATGTNSVFQPAHSSDIETSGCATAGDALWKSTADKPTVTNGRAKSVLNISLTSSIGDSFCGVVTTGKQVDNSEVSNSMIVSGENKLCADPPSKIIERVVEFYY